MKKTIKSRWRFLAIPVIAAAFVLVISFLVMQLWNYTLPSLTGISEITLWQAMALFFLCKILFGFSGPHKGGKHFRRDVLRERIDHQQGRGPCGVWRQPHAAGEVPNDHTHNQDR